MLAEDQKKSILADMQKFREKVSEYIQKKNELDECEKNIQVKMRDWSRVAEEERQIEAAMDVVLRRPKKKSRARDIKEEIESWQRKSETLHTELNQLRTDLLGQMRNIPIPVDLENPTHGESETTFTFFEGAELGSEVIDVMCDLLRQEPPINFLNTLILPDKVVVKDVSKKKEALSKLVDAIRSFRMRIDDLLKSYEQIDETVERLKRSKLYARVLKTLTEEGKLSTDKIAKMLGIDRKKAYDTCYNLTRSNWSPNPIIKTSSGEWELTLPGEIIVSRLFQKYGTRPEEETELSLQTNSG